MPSRSTSDLQFFFFYFTLIGLEMLMMENQQEDFLSSFAICSTPREKKETRFVFRSSQEAEYRTLADTNAEIICLYWLHNLV